MWIKKNLPVEQLILAATSLSCFLAVGVSLVSQHAYGMAPCGWCILQRLIFLLVGAVAMVGSLFRTRLINATFALSATLLCLAGCAAAVYQITIAAKLLTCSQTFADQFLGRNGLGLESAVPWLFGIYASCMDAEIHIFGVEYAMLSLGLFTLLGLAMSASIISAGITWLISDKVPLATCEISHTA